MKIDGDVRRISLCFALITCTFFLFACQNRNHQNTDSNTSEGSNPVYSLIQSGNAMVLDIKLSKPEYNKTKKLVTIKGTSSTQVGWGLPYLSFRIALPKNCEVTNIVQSSSQVGSQANAELRKREVEPIGPASKVPPIDTSEAMITYRIDSFGGAKSVAFSVHPVTYYESNKTISYSQKIRVQINCERGAWDLRQFGELESKRMREVVFNPEMVGTY